MKEKEIKAYVANKANVSDENIMFYGDFRVMLLFPMPQELSKIAKQFVKEYNELNNTIYGSATDVAKKFYLIGARPSGCVMHKMPKRIEEYDRLREWLLDSIGVLKGKGFEVTSFEIKEYYNTRLHEMRHDLRVVIADEFLWKWRNDCYNYYSDDFEREQEEERAMERRYEDMIIANSWS